MITTLRDLAPGTSAVITQIDATGANARRAAELGLRPGMTCTTITRTSGGGIVVAVADGRLGVDREIARAVHVEARPGGRQA